MNKIALTIAAVATLGLAACGGAETDAANDVNAVSELDATANEALVDVNAADAVNAADVALDNAAVDANATDAAAVDANATNAQ